MSQHPDHQLAQLATVRDDNLLGCLPTLRAERFYFLHDIHALFDMTEHHMLAIQPAGVVVPVSRCNMSATQRPGHGVRWYSPKTAIQNGTQPGI